MAVPGRQPVREGAARGSRTPGCALHLLLPDDFIDVDGRPAAARLLGDLVTHRLEPFLRGVDRLAAVEEVPEAFATVVTLSSDGQRGDPVRIQEEEATTRFELVYEALQASA